MKSVCTTNTAECKIKPEWQFVRAYQGGGIRIEEWRGDSGSVYFARRDTGESILWERFINLSGVCSETSVEHCYSLWTVIEALAREAHLPLAVVYPEQQEAAPMQVMCQAAK